MTQSHAALSPGTTNTAAESFRLFGPQQVSERLSPLNCDAAGKLIRLVTYLYTRYRKGWIQAFHPPNSPKHDLIPHTIGPAIKAARMRNLQATSSLLIHRVRCCHVQPGLRHASRTAAVFEQLSHFDLRRLISVCRYWRRLFKSINQSNVEGATKPFLGATIH